MARNDLPINHNTFRRKQDGTATAGMVQVPPLLR